LRPIFHAAWRPGSRPGKCQLTGGGGGGERKTDRRINLLARLADCFSNARKPEQVEHRVAEMLSQRIYGLALWSARSFVQLDKLV
jgi:hypothetical protein